MKNLKDLIIEKLHISKDVEAAEPNEIEKEFQNKESVDTLKFILNCIRRSKSEPYNNSIFGYWEMYINKNKLSCMHLGWSHDIVGHRKSRYIDTCVDNYNKDNGTDIKVSISGWESDAGIPILQIKEVVDELKRKYSDFKIEDETKLVNAL